MGVDISDHSREYMRAFESQLIAALEAVGIHVEGEAKEELENTPRRIDTGNLRNSITHRVVPGESCVYVGTNVNYAIYVHEGTVNMAPNRFLKNAVERNKDQINQYLREKLG